MARKIVKIEETTLPNIASAIREKKGVTTEYKPSEMPDAIRSIITIPEPSTPINKTINPGESIEIPFGYYQQPSNISASLALDPDYVDDSIKEEKTIDASLIEDVYVEPSEGNLLKSVTVKKPDMSDADATSNDIKLGKKAYVNGNIVVGSYIPETTADTSNATASADDIREGKTAYLNGGLTLGTLKIVNYYSGINLPDSSLGINGDIYIQTQTDENVPNNSIEEGTNSIILDSSYPEGTYTLKYEDENNVPLEGWDDVANITK